MKEVGNKVASILMAFVVLCSTMSFTIDKHYCGDTLVSTAIFHEAKSCGMEMQKTIPVSECSFSKKDCCSNEKIMLEGQDELKISFGTLSLEQQQFVTSFVYSYIFCFEISEEKTISFSEYRPPPIVRSIHKIDEAYLI